MRGAGYRPARIAIRPLRRPSARLPRRSIRRPAATLGARRRASLREVRMNRVLLTGRLTRDPEVRSLASGKTVTSFSIATNDYRSGAEKAEYHSVVTWVWRLLRRIGAHPLPSPSDQRLPFARLWVMQ